MTNKEIAAHLDIIRGHNYKNFSKAEIEALILAANIVRASNDSDDRGANKN